MLISNKSAEANLEEGKQYSYLQFRSSMIGRSESEIYKFFTSKHEMDEESLAIQSAKAGTALHRLVLAQQFQLGNISTAEKHIHNKDYNFTGHIDAISPTLGIGDVKTVSRSAYKKIQKEGPADSHISQVNSYMATTGNHKGYIQYIMREDPTQQLVFKLKYDDALFQSDMDKVKRVQERVKKELRTGDLSFSQLRQGDSSEVLAREGAKAHSLLESDVGKVDQLIDYFLYYQGKLDKTTGESEKQKIAFASRRANQAVNPVESRWAPMHNMYHGWFGSQRSENTGFGSPSRIGDAHRNPFKMGDLVGLSDAEIRRTFGNQMSLDIETLSLKGSPTSTLQIGMGHGNNRFTSLFARQKSNSLSEFLQSHSAIGSMVKTGKLDLTKLGEIKDYSASLSGVNSNAQVKAMVTSREEMRKGLTSLFKTAKTEGKNILVSNGNFEIDQIKYLMGEDSTVNFSKEFISMRERLRAQGSADVTKYVLKEINKKELFKRDVARQIQMFEHVMTEARSKSGKLIDIMEISKTLNAVAQDKGLIPRTGRFGLGTNIEDLSRVFLNKTELHEAVSDVSMQNKIASNRSINLIRDISSGKITKDNIGKQQQWVQQWFSMWNDPKQFKALHEKSMRKMIEGDLLAKGHVDDIDPRRNIRMLKGEDAVFDKILGTLDEKHKSILEGNKSTLASIDGRNSVKMFRQGAAVAGSVLVFAALRNAFKFSGRDDDANTIEGLKHGGWAQQSRKLHSDFGSGYRGEEYHERGSVDPTDSSYMPLVATGTAFAALRAVWNKPFGKTQIDDLGYFGAMSLQKTNSQILGRTQATYGDVVLSGIKRIESAAGGLPKSFAVSELIGSPSYQSAEYTIDITKKDSTSYKKYIAALTEKDMKGVQKVTYRDGKLFFVRESLEELVEGQFTLKRLSHDLRQQESMTQLSKALIRNYGVNYIDPKLHAFVPVGGEGLMKSSAMKTLHAYVTETISKYISLTSDPLEAIRNTLPDVNVTTNKKIRKITTAVPSVLGLKTPESELLGGAHKVLGRHAGRIGLAAGIITFGLGTFDWAARQIGPDGTAMGDAGALGVGAWGLRSIHQGYAKISDITGLTAFRDKVEEMSPGMSGWKAVVGLTLSGAVTGGVLGAAEGLTREISKSGTGAYKQFIDNKKGLEAFSDAHPLSKVMKGEYTRVSRYSRTGGAIGMALSLPWMLSGLGADQSYGELEAEYEGIKEVDVRKGRYWEASLTPWEGGKIEYHRPNWYARLMDNAKTAELFDGDDISPIGKLLRSIKDPYWLEKRRYDKQPYPYAGPDGSSFGMFSSVYEMTIGRAMKAPAIMHGEELAKKVAVNEGNYQGDVSASMGGYGADPITPGSAGALARKQWSSLMESMGLRGFTAGALKERITGEKELGIYNPELAHSGAMDNATRDFHDLQIGGGLLSSEAIRRVLQREEVGAVQRINPLENLMPSWMPGHGYHTNFHQGDPFAKVKEGYYRLPGEGFATRYEELKGMNPEDYPDIYKYKILADVGFGSTQFKELKGKLENRVLTPTEMTIFNQVTEQLEERNESNTNFRDPATYETFLGRYAAFLTDVARSNPLEQLLPFSPGSKFLPGLDPIDAYEASIYGKSFRRWSHPFEDFVMPAIRTSLNMVGMQQKPEEIEYANQLEDYFDKVEYLKYQKLAEEAKASGDQGTANMYMQQAERTMSGLDPYMNQEELLKRIPQRDRGFFKAFVNANENEKAQILEMSSPAMRDIYMAQWDKTALDQLESGTVEMDKERRAKMQQEIKTRAAQNRARRKAKIQDFSRSSQMPQNDWAGWDRRVDLEDVKMKHLINEGRDYHYYGLWKDRLNTLSRKPYVNAAADNVNFKPTSYRSRYADAHARAREVGIVDPRISIQPGLEEGMDLEVQLDKSHERNMILRDLGYVI